MVKYITTRSSTFLPESESPLVDVASDADVLDVLGTFWGLMFIETGLY